MCLQYHNKTITKRRYVENPCATSIFKKKKKVDSFGYSGINTINLIFKDAAKKMPP